MVCPEIPLFHLAFRPERLSTILSPSKGFGFSVGRGLLVWA